MAPLAEHMVFLSASSKQRQIKLVQSKLVQMVYDCSHLRNLFNQVNMYSNAYGVLA